MEVKENDLILYSFYPGQKSMIKVKFIKHEWLQMVKELYLLNNLVDDKISMYKKIYGIKKVFFNKLCVDNFTFNYSVKYL